MYVFHESLPWMVMLFLLSLVVSRPISVSSLVCICSVCPHSLLVSSSGDCGHSRIPFWFAILILTVSVCLSGVVVCVCLGRSPSHLPLSVVHTIPGATHFFLRGSVVRTFLWLSIFSFLLSICSILYIPCLWRKVLKRRVPDTSSRGFLLSSLSLLYVCMY